MSNLGDKNRSHLRTSFKASPYGEVVVGKRQPSEPTDDEVRFPLDFGGWESSCFAKCKRPNDLHCFQAPQLHPLSFLLRKIDFLSTMGTWCNSIDRAESP